MGTKRWLKHRLVPFSWLRDTRDIFGEADTLKDGIKRVLRNGLEDDPITGLIYRVGQDEGKREGVVEASDVYQTKFEEQEKDFWKKVEEWDRVSHEKDVLLDECKEELERRENKNNEDDTYMKEIECREQAVLEKLDEM